MFPDTPKTLLKKIAELAQGDDRAEWEAFVELYEPPLKQFVRIQSPTMAEADVEDVVQDVFIRLVRVLREGQIDRTKAKLRAYLASMTRRILIDRYRAAQVRPHLDEVPVLPDSISPLDETASSMGCPSADTIDPGVAIDILWRMASHDAAKTHVFSKTAISDQSKRVYELLERGLSPREVAEQTGVSYDSVKQVKSRIDRAIAAVEQMITLDRKRENFV